MVKNWEDFVFLLGGFVLAIALLPSVLGDEKPPAETSLLTAVILTFYVFAFASWKKWLSCAGIAAGCALWWTLFVQAAL